MNKEPSCFGVLGSTFLLGGVFGGSNIGELGDGDLEGEDENGDEDKKPVTLDSGIGMPCREWCYCRKLLSTERIGLERPRDSTQITAGARTAAYGSGQQLCSMVTTDWCQLSSSQGA